MADNVTLSVDIDGALQGLIKASKNAHKGANAGLAKAAMQIVNEAKKNLKDNESIATGNLRASGKAQKVDDLEVDFGFFSESGKGYAEYVEYGRKAGRMPPPKPLGIWGAKKFGIPPEKRDDFGWSMAMVIAKKGTKPHPFFQPAIEANESKIEKMISEEIAKELDKI